MITLCVLNDTNTEFNRIHPRPVCFKEVVIYVVVTIITYVNLLSN